MDESNAIPSLEDLMRGLEEESKEQETPGKMEENPLRKFAEDTAGEIIQASFKGVLPVSSNVVPCTKAEASVVEKESSTPPEQQEKLKPETTGNLAADKEAAEDADTQPINAPDDDVVIVVSKIQDKKQETTAEFVGGDESMDEKQDDFEAVPEGDLNITIPCASVSDELDYFRRKSRLLEKQLEEEKNHASTKEKMLQKYRDGFFKVSDLLNSVKSEDPGTTKTNLYSTIKEIWGVVENNKSGFQELKIDSTTSKWLDSMFHTEEDGFQLENEDMSPTSPGALSYSPLQRARSPTSPGAIRNHRKSIHITSPTMSSFAKGPLLRTQSALDEQALDEEVIAVLKREEEWNVWSLSELQMMASANEMLHRFGMVNVFNVKQTAFRRFFSTVARLYKPQNPYHNFYHGYDVMKTCFYFLEVCELGKKAPNLSGYALLLAGLCHDIGHPGTNNNFQVQSGSEIALRYNDHSVLENYHASLTFRCMGKGNNEMYGNLDTEGRREMRKIIVECILATDISHHVKLLKMVNEGSVGDHLLQLKLILCASDVSNPIKPFAVAKRWSTAISAEFYSQGDLERSKKMNISPFCDRRQPHTGQFTINFIDFVVNPVMSALKQMYPTYTKRLGLILNVLAERRESLRFDVESEKKEERLVRSESSKLKICTKKVGSNLTKTLPPVKTSPKSPPRKFSKIKRRIEGAYGQPMK